MAIVRKAEFERAQSAQPHDEINVVGVRLVDCGFEKLVELGRDHF